MHLLGDGGVTLLYQNLGDQNAGRWPRATEPKLHHNVCIIHPFALTSKCRLLFAFACLSDTDDCSTKRPARLFRTLQSTKAGFETLFHRPLLSPQRPQPFLRGERRYPFGMAPRLRAALCCRVQSPYLSNYLDHFPIRTN